MKIPISLSMPESVVNASAKD
jgi:hypothetical protein